MGGSLLDLPDLAERLRCCLRQTQATEVLLLIGGGQAVNLVRDWQNRFSVSDAQAHQLAIEAMHLNAKLMAELLPEAVWMTRFAERQPQSSGNADRTSAGPAIGIIDAPSFLHESHPASHPTPHPASHSLPASWDLTSDSIAAFIATALQIDRLLLLKSVSTSAARHSPPDRTACCHALAAEQSVDPLFGRYAESLHQLLWCNLRTAPDHIVRLW